MWRLAVLVLGACGRIAFDARDDASTASVVDAPIDTTPETAAGCGFTQLAAGGLHMCARNAQNELYCWGDNTNGDLGNGTPSSPVVAPARSLGSYVALGDSDQATTCAIRADRSLACWGANTNGQLGPGPDSATPVAITTGGVPFDRVIEVEAGEDHVCARRDDRTVWCWGRNNVGQVGVTAGADVMEPTQVFDGIAPLLADELAVGYAHNCARIADRVECWGWNLWGQLGDTTTTSREAPAPAQLQGAPFTGVTALAAGYLQTCAVRADGAAYCWGTGIQVGNPANGGATSPTAVPVFSGTTTPMTGVATIDGGDDHGCARLADGTVECWGNNGFLELGDSTGPDRAYGAKVLLDDTSLPLTGALALAVGNAHACALRATDVRCWGRNTSGQLGVGDTAPHVAATAITCP